MSRISFNAITQEPLRAEENVTSKNDQAVVFSSPRLKLTRNIRNSKPLSKMENTCLDLMCRGFTVKQIARQLTLSPKTIETYVERAKIKFNAKNKAELIWAILNVSRLRKN